MAEVTVSQIIYFFQGEVFYNNRELHVFYAIDATDFLQPALDRRMSVDRNWIDLHLLYDTGPKAETEPYVIYLRES